MPRANACQVPLRSDIQNLHFDMPYTYLFGMILKQTAIISLYGMKKFVFIMGKECVLFEVATELGLKELLPHMVTFNHYGTATKTQKGV
jgi:hypothetical protein